LGYRVVYCVAGDAEEVWTGDIRKRGGKRRRRDERIGGAPRRAVWLKQKEGVSLLGIGFGAVMINGGGGGGGEEGGG
jgi:hypothetical protein